MQSSRTDAELLKAAAGKDKGAFKELMERYQGRIYSLAYRFSGDRETAQELTQDIFFKVYRSAGRYRPDARFFTWLYRIAANHCINFTKKRRRDPLQKAVASEDDHESGFCLRDDAPGIAEQLEQRERAMIVRSALDSLPERQKMAVMLLRFDDLSYREISEVLGCSVSAVESLIHRATTSLKRTFLKRMPGSEI